MNPYYHLKRESEVHGPYSLIDLQALEASGQLYPHDLLRKNGKGSWIPAQKTLGLFGRKWPFTTIPTILMGVGAGCGMTIFGLICLLVLFAFLADSSTAPSVPTSVARSQDQQDNPQHPASAAQHSEPQKPTVTYANLEEEVRAFLHEGFNANKQALFDKLHPVGTAKNVKVHEITFDKWRNGINTGKGEDVKQFTVTFTLYWEGPIEKDGYTKITQTFDTETERYVEGRILYTNGTTSAEVGEAIGFLGGLMLLDAMNSN